MIRTAKIATVDAASPRPGPRTPDVDERVRRAAAWAPFNQRIDQRLVLH
jgi:hypothetical protein